MGSHIKFLGEAVIASILMSSLLSACQPKIEPVAPTAEEQASLNRLYKKCIPATTTTPSGKFKNLAKHRKPNVFFTCDDMKQLCESDYANERCQSMIIVTSIENAYHSVCRKTHQRSACQKLQVCNVKGFESPECLTAIKPYNR